MGDPYVICFVGERVPNGTENELFTHMFDEALFFYSDTLLRIVDFLNGGTPLVPLHPDSYSPPLSILFDNGGQDVNIVFANVGKNNAIEARFFRRGMGRNEIRMSGLGAVAATIAAYHTNLIDQHMLTFAVI